MSSILTWLGSLFAGPLIDAYKAKLAAGNDHERIAADLAKSEMDTRRAIVTAQLGSWFTALPMWLIGMSMALYIAKLVIWDKILGLGTTDPLTGDLREWAQTVIVSMFGYGGVSAVAKAYLSR